MFASLAIRLFCVCTTVCRGEEGRLQDGADTKLSSTMWCIPSLNGGTAG